MKMELIEGSETSANHNRTPRKYPKEYIQDSKHGESLKSRIIMIIKISPITAPTCLEGSRKLRFPDYVTMAQAGGKVISLTHRWSLPPGNAPGTHFCQRLSRPQGHSAIGRIMSMKIPNDTIWDRNSDLPICSTAP